MDFRRQPDVLLRSQQSVSTILHIMQCQPSQLCIASALLKETRGSVDEREVSLSYGNMSEQLALPVLLVQHLLVSGASKMNVCGVLPPVAKCSPGDLP